MNDKNQKLLFSDSDEETVVITLTDEDGQDIDAEIMAALEIEEFGKEYVAVMPQQATEDLADESDKDEEWDDEDDEDEEDDSDGFLSDIGDILPGISIKKD